MGQQLHKIQSLIVITQFPGCAKTSNRINSIPAVQGVPHAEKYYVILKSLISCLSWLILDMQKIVDNSWKIFTCHHQI